MMEESDLLKERLQAITEKRRVQEDIRQKKQELDREKLKLKHLKKTALREQWLLGDSASHNALQQRQKSLLADQQQTRILQSNIHRIESEVESLEREESMISTNERFILLRLKAVEKSAEEIIKEAQKNFIPEPIQYITATPDQPQSLSLPANGHANPPRQTLFAMEINVAKNLLTGESKVVSTATVTPQELSHCSGIKVYDDGRKCVFALEANRGSHDMGGNVSELSPSEVEQLLRDATQHRRGNHRQNGKGEGHHYNNQHDSHRHGNHELRNNQWEEDNQHHSSDQESCYRSQKDRVSHNDQGHHHRNQQWVGPGFRRQEDDPSVYHQERNGHRNQCEDYRSKRSSINSVVEDDHSVYHQERNGHRNQCEDYRGKRSSINSVVRSVSERSPRAIVCPRPPPRAHDPEVAVPAYHPELSYTPANHIPLSDYVSVEEEELYVYKPPPYRPERGGLHHRDVKSASAALFYDPRGSARGPSPLCEPDAPYRILDAMDTNEPITAVFLGFQTSQDESDQEYDGSIKAELVVIGDDDDYDEYVYGEEKPSQTEANGEAWQEDMASDRRKAAVQLWIEEELII